MISKLEVIRQQCIYSVSYLSKPYKCNDSNHPSKDVLKRINASLMDPSIHPQLTYQA